MKRYPLGIAVLGIVLVLAGLVVRWDGGPPPADPAVVAACEARLQGQAAEMVGRCRQSAFATAMTATDANAAAAAISNANNSEVGGSMAALFLIGLGVVLMIAGALMVRHHRHAAS
jgi:hypothetical protein